MKTKIYLLLFMLFLLNFGNSQDYGELSDANVKAMSIPSSPAFSLLGVNPESVMRPSDVKQFKVDWRIKNYNIAPDLALEAQPLWYAYYRRLSPKKYAQLDKFYRVLSTTTLSLATAKVDNANHMAYAIKLNLYKEYDPYTDSTIVFQQERELLKLNLPINQKIEDLSIKILESENVDSIQIWNNQLDLLRYERMLNSKMKMEEYATICNDKIVENWNMDMVDVAFGRVYKYDNSALDSLNFQKAGYGIWINAAKGIGKNGLLTGILRINKIGANRNYITGLAYRIGNHRYNFFAELVRTRLNNVPENGFAESELFANKLNEDIGMGWYQYGKGPVKYTNWTMTYGGDFKLSRNILLNFALRTELTSKIKFKRFLPVANIVCLMN